MARRSERLPSDFINLKRSVIDDFDKLGSRVSLLHGNIRQDPSIADFSLRHPWERISFLKSSFSETVSKMLPVLKIMNQPLLLQQVESLLSKYLYPPLTILSSLQAKLLSIDRLLSAKLLPRERS